MGLDVYLYHYKNFEKSQAAEQAYEDFSKLLLAGREYDKVSEQERKEIRDKEKVFAVEHGLDEYGSNKTYSKAVEKPSKKYPKHEFKIGYFRSSYNGSGINRILDNMGLPTLYDIFGVKDEYIVQVNWEEALSKIIAVRADFQKKLQRAEGKFRVFDVAADNMFRPGEGVRSQKEALEIFKEELKKDAPFDVYGNLHGEFFRKEPIKVVALIRGSDALGQPAFYVIEERKDTTELDSYAESLEIVEETIRFVLSKRDSQNYWLHWSA